MGTEGGGWENDEYLEATKTRPVSDNVELMRQAEVPFPSTSGFLYFLRENVKGIQSTARHLPGGH